MGIQNKDSRLDPEQLFRLSFENAAVGMTLINPAGQYIRVNQKMAEITGYRKEELLQKTFQEITHPEDLEEDLRLAGMLRRGEIDSYTIEKRYLKKNGLSIWIELTVSAVNASNGEVIFIIGVVEDISKRKQAEEDLRKSEEKYHSLFESIDEGFCICEMLFDGKGNPCDYRWLEINPTWEKQTGLKDPVGKTALELVPDLEQYWIDIYGKVVLTGEPVRFQQGSEAMGRWFDVYSFPIREPHLSCFGILFNDITARIQMEEKLRHNEMILREQKERLQAALEGGKMGTWDLDLKNGIVNRSLRHDQIWGYPEGTNEWTLESALKQVVPEDHEVIRKAYEKAYKTGILHHENRIIWPDGSLHWIAASGSIRYNEKGEPERVTGVVENITHRKEAELKLKESEQKFRMLANNISQLAWMADNQGKIIWINQRWIDYTGLPQHEIEGYGWKKIIHPEHIEQLGVTVGSAIQNEEAWDELVPLKNREGGYRWFLFRVLPVWDETANSLRWFGTATDMTKHREIEDLLKKDKELVENLLYIAAHDLKGPVANMKGFFEIMNQMSPEKKLMVLEHFEKLAEQLDKTIGGITDILRVRDIDNSSASVLSFEAVLNDILLELKHELSPSSVVSDFDGKPTIKYFEPFLHSIMINLISNSIKYSRSNVPLRIEIITQTKGIHTLLAFRDNGIGIDMKKFGDRLFSPFQRLEVVKTTGTGIGLYLIKSIIEKNGGYIEVESTPGEGTTFFCFLKEY